MTIMSDRNIIKNGSACIKYKSHIVEMAGKEHTLANKEFIHVFVYRSGDTLFVSKKEHNSGSW